MCETKSQIADTVVEAFSLIWDMYTEAIETIPEEHWRRGDIDYLIPARQVYHVLEAADFYSGSEAEGFKWGYRFNADWEKAQPEKLPTQEEMIEYHDEMMEKVGGWLRGMGISDLLSREDEFTWTGSTVLGRALYLLAHYRQHMGEINAELRRRGLPRIKWKTY
ncbi:MAG: hypothetical protein ACETVY_06930 [Candidatus Bathyarchaeia archaeon]